MAVTENNTNLRRSSTLLGQFADLVNDLIGGGLQPRWGVAGEWDGRGGDTLALGVKSTHDELVVCGVGKTGLSAWKNLSLGCSKFEKVPNSRRPDV